MPTNKPAASKSKKARVPADKTQAPGMPLVQDAVDEAGPARQEPEDRRASARQTTPAGKGRSQ